MSIQSVSQNLINASFAYNKSTLFDKIKNGEIDDKDKKSKDTFLEQETLVTKQKEQEKPNTIPFKKGLKFEYNDTINGDNIEIVITEKNHIKVSFSNNKDFEQRKKNIRSLVMLATDKIKLNDFNELIKNNKLNIENIKDELKIMGLDTKIPFGLGQKSFYINDENMFSKYKVINVIG